LSIVFHVKKKRKRKKKKIGPLKERMGGRGVFTIEDAVGNQPTRVDDSGSTGGRGNVQRRAEGNIDRCGG